MQQPPMTYVEKEILTIPHLLSTYRSTYIEGYFYSVDIHVRQKDSKTIYLMRRAEQVKDQPVPYFNTNHFEYEYASFAELEQDVLANKYPGQISTLMIGCQSPTSSMTCPSMRTGHSQ